MAFVARPGCAPARCAPSGLVVAPELATSRGTGEAVASALLFRARAGGPASRSGREPVTPCQRWFLRRVS